MTNRTGSRNHLAWGTLGFLLAAASCSSGTVVETGAAPEVPVSDAPEVLVPAADGKPGYNALKANGCEGPPPEQVVEALWIGWVPISELVSRASIAIKGRVVSVSEPRISTITSDPRVGSDQNGPTGPVLMYFRIMTVELASSPISTKVEGIEEKSIVDVLVVGAGPGVSPDDLCYGSDGYKDVREIPLVEGDSVVVLGEWQTAFPIIGMEDRPIVFLTDGLIGLWRVGADGGTDSVTEGYGVAADDLWIRLREEFEAAGSGKKLEVSDSLSVEPTLQDLPASPTTTAPAPPGSDAPDSPTIVPPTEPEG